MRMRVMTRVVKMVTTVRMRNAEDNNDDKGGDGAFCHRFDEVETTGSFLGANHLVVAGDVHVPGTKCETRFPQTLV